MQEALNSMIIVHGGGRQTGGVLGIKVGFFYKTNPTTLWFYFIYCCQSSPIADFIDRPSSPYRKSRISSSVWAPKERQVSSHYYQSLKTPL